MSPGIELVPSLQGFVIGPIHSYDILTLFLRRAEIGFAGLSAIVSLSKGLLIPVLQTCAYRRQKAAVMQALRDSMGSAEIVFEDFSRTLSMSSQQSILSRKQAEETLRNQTTDAKTIFSSVSKLERRKYFGP